MLDVSTVVTPQTAWYRGDFHAHTNCSPDGHYPPHGLVGLARAEGLDFCTITDHNAITAFDRFHQQPDILVIPGVEVTLGVGHFNVFGIKQRTAWLEQICAVQGKEYLDGPYKTPTELMQQIQQENLVCSINHPLRDSCRWFDKKTDLRYVNCVEIWNKPSFPEHITPNCQAVAWWTETLNAGHRLTAIGGSDYHLPIPKPTDEKPPERLGQPSTYVLAKELSVTGILAGLRQRRVYVSMGATVEFAAEYAGQIYPIGSDLGAVSGEVVLTATILQTPAAGKAQLVKNGEVVLEQAVSNTTAITLTETLHPDQPTWYRLDVIGDDGHILAITNPIFAGPSITPEGNHFGDFL